MKITSIDIGRISIPLARPFRTALREVSAIDDVAVRITTDEGLVGWGEAPPTAAITGDTIGSIVAAIEGHIAPAIVGLEICNIEGIMERLHRAIVGNTSAKAAVDMAVYDLWGKLHGAPLYRLLGGYRNEVETDITISVNSVEQMVADSLSAVAQGFRILKIKVGRQGLADIERVAAIRKAVGSDIVLRVDANQGWTARDAVGIIKAIEDKGLDVELVEQPVAARDIDGLRRITNAVDTPILADESVFSPADAIEIIRTHAADMINIKLMKTGGIHRALQLCDIAAASGVECMVGCMLESRLAVSAAVHLAAARAIVTRADLDGPALCKWDPFVGGPVFEAGTIRLGDEPGIGIGGVPGFGVVDS